MGKGHPVSEQHPELIAERYRVERQLGRGGMATVFQAEDLVKQRVVALKRLLPHEGQSPIARLFEREFHTLSQLVHPCIVEVYDYHTDALGPFYTMELLSGGDLRQRSPITWGEACRLLSDVCSALALLHSRRFVHRDLTPLNIRCTADGRAKLFDFGSMMQFGRSKHVVGTPPFVPPEALNGQQLDGQTDLYALGAAAYYALTGRHAYPARALAELPDYWRVEPPPPSQLVAGIPPAFDELVLSLLSHTPNARPRSAAEVMDRLSAIGGFALQEELIVEASYLATPTLVGRNDKLAAFQRMLQRAHEQIGTSILVSGEAGTGRSRLLDACALEAKLGGAIVVRADASSRTTEPWAAASTLFTQLHEQLPELTTQLLQPHAALIASFMPEIAARIAPGTAPAKPATETSEASQPQRGELQASLRDVLLRVARDRMLVIVADDLERIDEPSAALLALLAHRARNARLLILASLSGSNSARDQRAVRLIVSVADAMRLRNLDSAQTEQLVVSLFGEVPQVHWLADRIFNATRGNPALVMRIAQHLIDSGSARYAAGTWVLPPTVDPSLFTAAQRETLDPNLSPGALELARALALADLPRVTLDLAVQLTAHRDSHQLQAEILELSIAGVVVSEAEVVSISRPSLVRLLLDELPTDARRVLHARIAACLESDPKQKFRWIQQLLAAGEVDRAISALIADIAENRHARLGDVQVLFDAVQAMPRNWPQTFHTCIELCRTLDRPLRDRLELQTALTGFAVLTGRTERATVLELAEQMRRDTGLDLIAQYASQVPASELLVKALGDVQKRFEATPPHQRGFGLMEALPHLAALMSQALGMATRTLDRPLLSALPSLKPLEVLSPALAVVQRNVEASLDLLSGRTERARTGYLEIADRLEQPDGAGIPGAARIHMRYAVIWACGLIEAMVGRPSTLERATAVENEPLFAVSALRLRAIAALFQGDRAGAELYRVRMELLQIQNSPPQIFEGSQVLQWVFGYAAIGDMLRVKQYLVECEALAHEHASYWPVVHSSRAAYQSLRGDYVQAEIELVRAFELMPGTDHAAWPFAASTLLWTLVRAERYSEAVGRGAELTEAMRANGIVGNAYAVFVPLSLAQARVGEFASALSNIATSLEILSADSGAGVQLGQAYEVRAGIAIIMKDPELFAKYADLALQQYKIGKHASLLARHEKLMQLARHEGIVEAPQSDRPAQSSGDDVHTTVSTVLGAAHGPEERAERSLALLGRFSRSKSGYLYLLQRSGPVLVAQLGASPPLAEMDAFATQFLVDALDQQDATQTEVASASTGGQRVSWTLEESRRFAPFLLSHPTKTGSAVTGVAVMSMDPQRGLRSPVRLLHALSKALYDAGDALSELTEQFWNTSSVRPSARPESS